MIVSGLVSSGCGPAQKDLAVPHEGKWGIYRLDLSSLKTSLVFSTTTEIYSSALSLNDDGDRLVFAQKVDGNEDVNSEIFTIGTDGSNLTRLTNNNYQDVYPVWSPDGSAVAFISRRETFDIYIVDNDGNNQRKLYDSGDHDADIDWAGSSIVFTSGFAIWRMNSDGSQAVRISDFPERGEWGEANLPKGDYDPRLSKDGEKVVFERLEDTSVPNGGYNFFVISADGTGEARLTDNYYSQGLANWSHSGDKLVYVVAAISGEGKYDIYTMMPDGTDIKNITPSYYPAAFLCYDTVFAPDDASIYFIGQWWE